MPTAQPTPFRLNGALQLTHSPLDRLIEGGVERLFGLSLLDRLYRELPDSPSSDHFLATVLDLFDIDYRVSGLDRIPKQGPVVVVANHPFGAIEGVILAQLLRRYRPDVKLMANYLLQRVPEISDLFIAVDPFGGQGAKRANMGPLKEVYRHLANDGMLVIFPAGEVASRQRNGRVVDAPWSETVARIVRKSGADVLPIFIQGENSRLFHLLGRIHPRLRTAMLPREMINKKGQTLELRIGETLPNADLVRLSDDTELTRWLRLRTCLLGEVVAKGTAKPSLTGREVPIAPAQDSALIAVEVAALPVAQRLVEQGEMQVWYARAEQCPQLLQEIGRLREVTFRATGEGTGKARDIDLYDQFYLHLFIWHSERQELVGAYRLGLADQIITRYGLKGLYSHSLFNYNRLLVEQLNPAIELGRSFVREEYQRSFAPLLLLWRGIGEFVLANPRYRILFGPVSISSDYETKSQQLLVEFLQANNYLPELARHVHPRTPFRGPYRHWSPEEVAALGDVDTLSRLISELEADQKGVPILLKQYLKLGGRLLGFNVDPDFNNALDGLIMVDLARAEPRVLARYMGKEGAARFLALHPPKLGERHVG